MAYNYGLQKPSPELSLILLCAQDRTETNANMDNLLNQPLDWNIILAMAVHHRLYPLVYKSLSGLNHPAIPLHILNALHDAYRQNALMSVNMTGEMLRILQCLEVNGIKTLVLKGYPLALRFYGDLSLRPSHDVDILIDPEDLEKAHKIIEQQGYRIQGFDFGLTPRQKKAHYQNFHHLSYYNQERGVYLELHWRVHYLDLQNYALADLHTSSMEIAGCLVPAMADEELFLYLMVHGFSHRWFRLRWLCDIQRLMKVCNIDWDRLNSLAGSGEIETIVHQTMILLNQLLEVPIPESIATSVLSDKRAWNLARAVMDELMTPIDAGNSTRESYWLDFKIRNSYNLQLRSGWKAKLAYVGALFKPIYVDYQVISLPDRLYPLYYLIRPFNWLGRRIASLRGN